MTEARINITEHRGGWCNDIYQIRKYRGLQNTIKSFKKSFERGNSIETDLRDDGKGNILICHDMVLGENTTLTDLFELYRSSNVNTTLFLDIKATDLFKKLAPLLREYSITDYVCIGMSIQETVECSRWVLNYALRQSEYEPDPEQALGELYQYAKCVWFDQFNPCRNATRTSWVGVEQMAAHLRYNKKCVLTSPELHRWGKALMEIGNHIIWGKWREDFEELEKKGFDLSQIYLCTDLPIQAKNFFYGHY